MNFSEHNPMSDASGTQSPEFGSDDERHITLGGGDFSDADVISFEEKPKLKLNSGALLIVVVAMIAALGLFSMRTLTRASASTDAPKEIEKSIDEFLSVVLKKSGERQVDTEGVLDVLSESYAARQVPLEEVQRNPFIIFEPRPSRVQPADPVDPLASRRRARLAEFERAADRLRVGMILMGAQPMANVNNRVVRVGEMVAINPEVSFRVVRITADRVEFRAEDPELEAEYERSVNLRRE